MLMTLKQWQRATSRILADRKNPLITDLDILIGEYHAPNKTDLQKLKLLILIRRYCGDWLVEKSDKDNSFRKQHLTLLRDQTTTELQSVAMQQAMTQRKTGGSRQMAGKQMLEHAVEMLQPRANAKEKFGLKADMQMTRASAGNIEQYIADWNMGNPQSAVDEHDMIAVLDFVGNKNQRKDVMRSLLYLQKRERLAYRLQKWPDKCFHRGGLNVSHDSPDGKELYAIDDMEYIYTANQPAKAGSFHHSSFMSGKPVLCAGEITVTNGHIVHIDNLSGHYQPSTQNLLNCVNLLARKYEVNLNKVSIIDMANQGHEWAHAREFQIRSGKVPVPWQRGVRQ